MENIGNSGSDTTTSTTTTTAMVDAVMKSLKDNNLISEAYCDEEDTLDIVERNMPDKLVKISDNELEKCRPSERELVFHRIKSNGNKANAWNFNPFKNDKAFNSVRCAYNKILESELVYVTKPTIFNRILLKIVNLLLKPFNIELFFKKYLPLGEGKYADMSDMMFHEIDKNDGESDKNSNINN